MLPVKKILRSGLLGTLKTGVLACQRQISSAIINGTTRILQVTFSDDVTTPRDFPCVWLRDNCQCPNCFDTAAKQRTVVTRDLDADVVAKAVHVDTERKCVTVTWPDDHCSTYTKDWLKARQFLQPTETKRGYGIKTDKKLWGREMEDRIPTVDYQQLMADDRTLYEWIVGLEVDGIQLIKGAPAAPGVIRALGDRVAFLTNSHYGEIFTIMSKDDASSVAYTGKALALHLDAGYSDEQPGMQITHCISQTTGAGGDSTFVDAFYVAELLRENQPDMYHTLRTTLLNYVDFGTDAYGEFSKSSLRPTFCEDREGNLEMVTYSNHSRNSAMDLTVDEVQKFYKALVTFEHLLNKHSISYKLEEGDIACVDNFRVMHGRKAFQTRVGDKRHLQSSYISWDELRSKRRVLKSKLGIQ